MGVWDTGSRVILLLLILLIYSEPSSSAPFRRSFLEAESGTPIPTPDDLVTSQPGNTTAESGGHVGLANIIDKVLQKEFPEEEIRDNSTASNFNASVTAQEAVLETVARVSHDKPKTNDTEADGKDKPFQIADFIVQEKDDQIDDVERLIDSQDNEFVISNPSKGGMVLQSDLRFITDLVIVIVAGALGGTIFGSIGQPVITGYLLAGSLIGPGGFSWVQEIVQVETLAQFGVVLLLFALGLEFSLTKLKVVRGVAVMGGLLQIVLFMAICALTAKICGGSVSEGVFVGAFMSMSSTAVVLKCLTEKKEMQSLHGQITIGTLILQDCMVGLLFAMLPVLGGNASIMHGLISMTRTLASLALFLGVAALVTKVLLPPLLRLVGALSEQSHELFQLTTIAFCLAVAWVSDYCGLSIELGAFIAGVMMSASGQGDYTLHQVEPIRNIFGALFLTSIGMLINGHFLWQHIDILLASLVMVVVTKTILVTIVVRAFGYATNTALMVGISLAQIGEFAFVLLSRASNLELVQKRVYLLLLGTTALSLISTPLIFRSIPAIMRLGHMLHILKKERKQSTPETVVMLDDYMRTPTSNGVGHPWHLELAVQPRSGS